MMPVWSPGFYRVESYATNVHDVAAHGADGEALAVEQRSRTGGASGLADGRRSS